MSEPYLPALEAELRRAGVRYWHVETGKHNKLIFRHKGQRKMFVYPMSPSDTHGVKNAVGDLRLILGLSAPIRPKSARPPKRQAVKPDVEPVLTGGERPDPWAVLATLKSPNA